jgi:hypothetical protein
MEEEEEIENVEEKEVGYMEEEQEIECKTNALTILMHQMHISTNQVSSVMIR